MSAHAYAIEVLEREAESYDLAADSSEQMAAHFRGVLRDATAARADEMARVQHARAAALRAAIEVLRAVETKSTDGPLRGGVSW